MGCTNKTGNTCTINRKTVDATGSEETLTEVLIYENIKCYILKVFNKDFTQELALETDKSNILLKIGKKPNVKKGDILDLSDKDLGDMGRYRIEDLDPKRFKGRLKGIYLYIKKYNG